MGRLNQMRRHARVVCVILRFQFQQRCVFRFFFP